MPLTTLDPDTALIFIDLQQGIVNGNFIHPIAAMVHRMCAPIDAFRAQNLSAALVNVAERPPGRAERGSRANLSFSEVWTRLLPRLGRQPNDIAVTKRSWGAFATTDLERQLKARGVTQNVTLALDAVIDSGEDAHHYRIANVFPRAGETGTAKEIISLLERSPKERNPSS